jgi:hypothetical protein
VKGGGRRLRLTIDIRKMKLAIINYMNKKHTSGGLKYSMPILRALLVTFSTSLTRLYLSTLKLSVGPEVNLIILNEGAIGVNVNASKCVTCSAGAIVK